jgi:hypothetical protein
VSSDDEDSSIRGRIDRFFDKRAKEQQELLRGEIGGKKISDSWEDENVISVRVMVDPVQVDRLHNPSFVKHLNIYDINEQSPFVVDAYTLISGKFCNGRSRIELEYF